MTAFIILAVWLGLILFVLAFLHGAAILEEYAERSERRLEELYDASARARSGYPTEESEGKR